MPTRSPRSSPFASAASSMLGGKSGGMKPGGDLTDIKIAIRKHVVARKIRLQEFFTDFDRHKSGRVTRTQFKRGIAAAGVQLSQSDVERVAKRYEDPTDEYGSVMYLKFCNLIDKVFAVKGMEKDPLMLPSNPLARKGLSGRAEFGSNLTAGERERLQALLKRLKILVDTQRIATKPYFTGYDKHNRGFISETRFRRALEPCFRIDFSEDEKLLLCKAYEMHERAGSRVRDINYRELIGHVDEAGAPGGMKRPPKQSWDATMLDGPGRVPARTMEGPETVDADEVQRRAVTQAVDKNLDVKGAFQDFDILRSGYVTVSQFGSSLVKCGLIGFHKSELSALARKYYVEHKYKVDYSEFLKVLSAAQQNSVERQASTRTAIQLGDRSATKRDAGWGSEEARMQKLLKTIQTRMKTVRFGLKDSFQDYDRYNEGRVTRTQMARVLKMFKIDALVDSGDGGGGGAIDFIISRFVDRSQPNLVKYLDFLYVLDSPIDTHGPEPHKFGTETRWRPKPKPPAQAVDVKSLLMRIKGQTKRRGVRLREFLADFDPLRRGRMTRAQLMKGFSIAKFELNFEELYALADTYPAPDSEPLDSLHMPYVMWTSLCDDIDAMYTVRNPERNPTVDINAAIWQAQDGIAAEFAPLALDVAERSQLKKLLTMINGYVMTTRTEIEQPFKDFDPNRSGSMTTPQFERALRTAVGNAVRIAGRAKGEGVQGLSDADVALLMRAYKHPTKAGRTVYRRFINDLDAVDGVIGNLPEAGSGGAWADNSDPHLIAGLKHGERPKNRGELRPKAITDLKKLLEMMAVYTANNHIRIIDFFKDFDSLKKGYLPKSKFRTALNAAGFKLSRIEMELLEQEYAHHSKADMVEYDELVAYIAPETKKGSTRSNTTAADTRTEEGLELLRQAVRTKRILLKPYFQSHDRNHQGTVTKNQFCTVLNFGGLLHVCTGLVMEDIIRRFTISKANSAYDRQKIDYVQFCREIDPTEK